MILEKSLNNDNHYYYVMGWTTDTKVSGPRYKKKFNIYEDAIRFYNEILSDCSLVEMFEYIDGRRKMITPEKENMTESISFDKAKFEKETGLVIRKMDSLFGDNYRVISGQGYRTVQRKVDAYNKKNGTHITCYNDYTCDSTIIQP